MATPTSIATTPPPLLSWTLPPEARPGWTLTSEPMWLLLFYSCMQLLLIEAEISINFVAPGYWSDIRSLSTSYNELHIHDRSLKQATILPQTSLIRKCKTKYKAQAQNTNKRTATGRVRQVYVADPHTIIAPRLFMQCSPPSQQ